MHFSKVTSDSRVRSRRTVCLKTNTDCTPIRQIVSDTSYARMVVLGCKDAVKEKLSTMYMDFATALLTLPDGNFLSTLRLSNRLTAS